MIFIQKNLFFCELFDFSYGVFFRGSEDSAVFAYQRIAGCAAIIGVKACCLDVGGSDGEPRESSAFGPINCVFGILVLTDMNKFNFSIADDFF